MHKFLFLFLVILFQSCNSLEGGLHNYTAYELQDKFGKSVELKPGILPVVLELTSKNLFSISTQDHVFQFKIPLSQDLPETDGELELSSREVGQSFGVFAKIKTSVFRGELIRDREDCTWVESYVTCDRTGVCRTEYRSRDGVKEVSFRNDIHQKYVTLNLSRELSGEIVSQLMGQKTIVKKVYRYESSCY